MAESFTISNDDNAKAVVDTEIQPVASSPDFASPSKLDDKAELHEQSSEET